MTYFASLTSSVPLLRFLALSEVHLIWTTAARMGGEEDEEEEEASIAKNFSVVVVVLGSKRQQDPTTSLVLSILRVRTFQHCSTRSGT